MLVLATITGFQGEQYDFSGYRIFVDDQLKRALTSFLVSICEDEKHIMEHLSLPDDQVSCQVNVLKENRPVTPTRCLRVQIEVFLNNGQKAGGEAIQHFSERSELITQKIREYLPDAQVLLVT